MKYYILLPANWRPPCWTVDRPTMPGTRIVGDAREAFALPTVLKTAGPASATVHQPPPEFSREICYSAGVHRGALSAVLARVEGPSVGWGTTWSEAVTRPKPACRRGVISHMRALPLTVALLIVVCACSAAGTSQASLSPTASSGLSGSQPSPITPSTSPPTTATSPPPLVTSSTVEQLLARCPFPDELAAVDASVSMTFTTDPSAGRLVCTAAQGSRDLTNLQERAYQAILIFTWIRFDTPVPWTDLTLDAWFAHAIHGIDFRGDAQNSYCCEPGGVIVIQTNNLYVLTRTDDPHQTWDATRGLASVFVHEARHNEGFGHTCGTKDNTIAELGAWGVEYYFLLWLGTHSDPSIVPDLYRSAASLDAQQMLSAFFCNPPSPSPTP